VVARRRHWSDDRRCSGVLVDVETNVNCAAADVVAVPDAVATSMPDAGDAGTQMRKLSWVVGNIHSVPELKHVIDELFTHS